MFQLITESGSTNYSAA